MSRPSQIAMIRKFLVLHLLVKIAAAQINGEFWWLNNKFRSLNGADGEKPRFEAIESFENDDGDKIVFKNSNNSVYKGPRSRVLKFHFPIGNIKSEQIKDVNISVKPNKTESQTPDDELTFHYPKNDSDMSNIIKEEYDKSNKTHTIPTTSEIIEIVTEKNTLKPVNNEDIHAVDICSYTDFNSCNRSGGLVYNILAKETLDNKRIAAKQQRFTHHSRVCCILPLKSEDKSSPRIIYPDEFKKLKRITRVKRSNSLHKRPGITSVLNKAIQQKNKQAELKPTRIVTTADDYDEDPYANIRNPIFRPPRRPVNKLPTRPPEYEDYAAELPRPGMTGLYSDCGPTDKNFDYGGDDSSDESFDSGYGVATHNPLFDELTPAANTRFPVRHSTSSQKQTSYEAGSESITYHSYPDYQVLKGFKLLYLVRNRDRNYTKASKRSTTSSVTDYGSLEAVAVDAEERPAPDYDDDSHGDGQLYADCGIPGDGDESGTFKSSAWLALALWSRQQTLSMCYATLVHPRAAVTAASCALGASDGEMTLYAGVRGLGDTRRAQLRRPAVYAHAQYARGRLDADLAVLHWSRPLAVDAAVRPACVGAPRLGDACAFVGWGQQIETLSPRVRSQRAAAARRGGCERCAGPRRAPPAARLLCANVSGAGCVVSPGASLVCVSRGRYTAAGVLVARAACDVTAPAILLPPDEWLRRALTHLGIV